MINFRLVLILSIQFFCAKSTLAQKDFFGTTSNQSKLKAESLVLIDSMLNDYNSGDGISPVSFILCWWSYEKKNKIGLTTAYIKSPYFAQTLGTIMDDTTTYVIDNEFYKSNQVFYLVKRNNFQKELNLRQYLELNMPDLFDRIYIVKHNYYPTYNPSFFAKYSGDEKIYKYKPFGD